MPKSAPSGASGLGAPDRRPRAEPQSASSPPIRQRQHLQEVCRGSVPYYRQAPTAGASQRSGSHFWIPTPIAGWSCTRGVIRSALSSLLQQGDCPALPALRFASPRFALQRPLILDAITVDDTGKSGALRHIALISTLAYHSVWRAREVGAKGRLPHGFRISCRPERLADPWTAFLGRIGRPAGD